MQETAIKCKWGFKTKVQPQTADCVSLSYTELSHVKLRHPLNWKQILWLPLSHITWSWGHGVTWWSIKHLGVSVKSSDMRLGKQLSQSKLLLKKRLFPCDYIPLLTTDTFERSGIIHYTTKWSGSNYLFIFWLDEKQEWWYPGILPWGSLQLVNYIYII